jgi:DmsE family decaheme c-type cytochrome
MAAISSAPSKTAAIAAAVLLVFFYPLMDTGSAQEAASEEAPKREYVGSVMCQGCHEDIYNSFVKNRHWAIETDKRRGYENNSCESCHGPGSVHSETVSPDDIVNPAKALIGESLQSCLKCHARQPTNVGQVHNSHARNQVACVGCHSVHKPEAVATTNRNERINQQCYSCHLNQRASFKRPHAHPIEQGAMSCVDCHNPHGSPLGVQARLVHANEPNCFRCHGDKRGPFTFEHAPMRVEGCGSCHQPHGSANPRMLTRHEVMFQCLECHSNIAQPGGTTNTGAQGGIPPAFHDLRSPRIRNCTVCHIKVHGSHVNKAFLR